MIDRPSNQNMTVFPSMTARQLFGIFCFWSVYLSISAAFIIPDIPDGVINVLWFVAWIVGGCLFLFSIVSVDEINTAQSDGKASQAYAMVMTRTPIPPRAVSVITSGLLFAISGASASRGYYLLALVYLVVTVIGLRISHIRRDYRSAINRSGARYDLR